MSRLLRASILLLALASCGGGNFSAPRNLDDACAILRQRPAYWKALKATERKWGIPVHVQMAAIYQESKFIGNARTPHRYALGVIPMGRQSSAYGYSQALDGTWEEYQRDQRRRGEGADVEVAVEAALAARKIRDLRLVRPRPIVRHPAHHRCRQHPRLRLRRMAAMTLPRRLRRMTTARGNALFRAKVNLRYDRVRKPPSVAVRRSNASRLPRCSRRHERPNSQAPYLLRVPWMRRMPLGHEKGRLLLHYPRKLRFDW